MAVTFQDGNGDYPHGLLALELASGLLAGQHWRLQISPAYECSKSEVAAFDSGFPPKEKAHQYSQDIFSIAVRSPCSETRDLRTAPPGQPAAGVLRSGHVAAAVVSEAAAAA